MHAGQTGGPRRGDPRQHPFHRCVTVESAFVGLVAITACLAAAVWALVVPFNGAPDELGHFRMARYVAAHSALPIYDRSPEIDHTSCASQQGPCYGSYASAPPGGPLLSAALMKVQHALTGQPYDTLNTAARFASVLCLGVYVPFLYLAARALLDDQVVRLTALVLGAFIPQVSFLAGYTNDDMIGLAAGAAALYLAILVLRDGLDRRLALLAGLDLGVLALAKLNYYSVVLAFGLCAFLRLAREWRGGTARRFLGLLMVVLLTATAVSGWWFVRGIILYHDPFGTGIYYQRFYEVAPNYRAHTLAGQGFTVVTMLQKTPWIAWSFQSFWGLFDYMSLHLPLQVYTWIEIFVCACIGGALTAAARALLARRRITRAERWRAQIWLMLVGLVVLTIAQSLWTSLYNDFQPQGRYLYPALVPIVLLLAVGLHGFSRRRFYRTAAFGAATIALVSLNLYALMFVIVPTYYSWPGR